MLKCLLFLKPLGGSTQEVCPRTEATQCGKPRLLFWSPCFFVCSPQSSPPRVIPPQSIRLPMRKSPPGSKESRSERRAHNQALFTKSPLARDRLARRVAHPPPAE